LYGEKITFDQVASICRLRTNTERERQGGIVAPRSPTRNGSIHMI
jgi:hypothetical protein